MSLKACSYRNCQNYVLDNVPSGNFTMFQFPKNLEKRKKWVELGQAPNNLGPSTYYYCSDHFDRRFLAVNQRRTILVGEALPYPCSKSNHTLTPASKHNSSMQTIFLSQSVDEDHEQNDEYILCEMKEINRENVHEQANAIENTHQLQVESTMVEDEEGNIKHNFYYDFNLEKELEEQSNDDLLHDKKIQQNMKVVKKRKLNKDDIPAENKIVLLHRNVSCDGEDQRMRISTPTLYESILNDHTTTLPKTTELSQDGDVDEYISHNKDITKFIYKGEEYIQMPLNHYVNEKLILTKKIEKLTNILQAISGQIDTYREDNK